ncbi:MAG TPA: sigma-70 family RNA polymerase sigma factor [Kofleriaceae bacterium]|nr:sigma-70 family RNA polymerase sigma factor [Kofleriaceae bacterium]
MDAVDPDLVLLERWRSGERRAGEDLFARHFADIYRFFEHKTGGEADELAQQTFMACVAGRDAFRGQSTFRTYLFAIARNQLYSYLRRAPQRAQANFAITSIAEIVTSLSSRIGRAQQIEQLRLALSELPAEEQLLLELHYWHDLDSIALGEVFETTSGAIRVRLLRARRALHARMKQLGFALPTRETSDGLASALARSDSSDES